MCHIKQKQASTKPSSFLLLCASLTQQSSAKEAVGWQGSKKKALKYFYMSLTFPLTLSNCVCVCASPEAEQVMCVWMLGELVAEGGGGNIKQRFCVLSSHCLDRTPPRPNEVFVCLYLSLLRTHRHTRHHTSWILVGLQSSCETFLLKSIKRSRKSSHTENFACVLVLKYDTQTHTLAHIHTRPPTH